MRLEMFEIERWQSMYPGEKENLARQLVGHLPQGFAFSRLGFCSLGTQSHTVAFFNWNPPPTLFPEASWCYGTFALIPGGFVTLGHDRENPWCPTQAQQEGWNNTQEEYGVPDLQEYLDKVMTPVRTLHIAPFLMEVAPIETRRVPPRISYSSQYMAYSGSIVNSSRAQGFRSPFSDEWEWACAAGARTLWRWGDDCPDVGYPTQHSHYLVELRAQGVPAENRDPTVWELHELPNAFGLTIAHNDYEQDYCEGDIVRGGDGGSITCGGAGFLGAWLLLASSHFAICSERERGHATRRVFPLEKVLS